MTDNSTIIKAQAQMQRCALSLAALADDLADSKQIKEYDSERRKRALSIQVAAYLDTGESATAAEHKARASDAYGSQIHDLGEQYKAALRVIEKADVQRILWESSRSLLSVERAKIGMI